MAGSGPVPDVDYGEHRRAVDAAKQDAFTQATSAEILLRAFAAAGYGHLTVNQVAQFSVTLKQELGIK